MKNLNLSFVLLIILFGACNSVEFDDSNLEKIPLDSNKFIRTGHVYLTGPITVSCGTNKCTGGNIGQLETCQTKFDMTGKFECTCSGCEMTVTSDEFSTGHDIFEQIRREDHNKLEFENFTLNKHGQKISSFKSIEFNFRPLVTTISYTYELKNGTVENVMFANTYNESGLLVKKVTVDCTGTCGCREEYNATTEKFSCSCDPCKMTVTTED